MIRNNFDKIVVTKLPDFVFEDVSAGEYDPISNTNFDPVPNTKAEPCGVQKSGNKYPPVIARNNNALETAGIGVGAVGAVVCVAGLGCAIASIASRLSEGPAVWLEGVYRPQHQERTDRLAKAFCVLTCVGIPIMSIGAGITIFADRNN